MKLEALKHQGKANGFEGEAADEVGKKAGDSGRSVRRYIRLTYLIPELLELVDNKKLGFINAVSLSYLKNDEQLWVYEVYVEEGGYNKEQMEDIVYSLLSEWKATQD